MMTLHLQGIGKREAIEAKDLKPGMTITWNYGCTSEVIAVEFSKSGKTLTATLRSGDGVIRERRMSASKLVVAR